MATMSIGKAWEEASAFVRRERALLLPVAALFVALPAVILQEMTPPELTQWSMAPNRATLPPVPGSYWAAMILTFLLIWFGSLALFALALRPGISVGEALRLSLSRLPVLIGTAALGFAALMLITVVATLLAGILSIAARPAAILVLVGVGGAMLYASIRLMLLHPVVIDGKAGVVASIRQAWALTKGHFWRLLAFIVVIMMLSLIVGGAAQTVLGALAGLVGGAEAARIVGGIAGAAVSTVVQVYLLVMLARLYRQAAG